MPSPSQENTQLPTASGWREIAARFRRNSRGYVDDYWVWLVAAAIATMADMITTMRFMQELGPEAELHPVVRLVSHVFGPYLGPAVGKLGQFAALIVVTIYLKPAARWVFGLVIVLYSGAAIYNIWMN